MGRLSSLGSGGVNRALQFLVTLLLVAGPGWALEPATSRQQLADVFRRISQATSSQRPYRLAVAQNRELNAYATGNGQVVFYSGLLDALPDENALAFVMAHEISHIELGHATKAQVTNGVLGTALGLLVGGQPAVVRTGAVLAHNLVSSGYSRAMESEADRAAMALMDRAGYNPLGAVDTLRLFQQMEQNQGIRLFPTHPPASERLRDVSTWIEQSRRPLAAEQILAVPRPFPAVSEVIATGRQLAERVRTVPLRAGDHVARQALEQANQALADYARQPAEPLALARLREGLRSAQTFGLLASSLALDADLASQVQGWSQRAAAAERNQSLDQAARTRQFANYLAEHLALLGRTQPLERQSLAAISRLAQAAAAYESTLKGQSPGTQAALDALLSAAQDWERQRSQLSLDPKSYGGLLNGLQQETLALGALEGRL